MREAVRPRRAEAGSATTNACDQITQASVATSFIH